MRGASQYFVAKTLRGGEIRSSRCHGPHTLMWWLCGRVKLRIGTLRPSTLPPRHKGSEKSHILIPICIIIPSWAKSHHRRYLPITHSHKSLFMGPVELPDLREIYASLAPPMNTKVNESIRSSYSNLLLTLICLWLCLWFTPVGILSFLCHRRKEYQLRETATKHHETGCGLWRITDPTKNDTGQAS